MTASPSLRETHRDTQTQMEITNMQTDKWRNNEKICFVLCRQRTSYVDKRHSKDLLNLISLATTLSQQDPEKSNITVGFFIVLYRIWALFAGTNKDKILSRALFEIFIKNWWFVPFFQCRFYWVFWKSFLTAYLNSWWNFHSFDRSHYTILSKNEIFHF